MDALNKALQIKPDYFEALSYLNLLYREKAKIETDPAKKQEYTDTANKYLQQALELRSGAEKALAEAAGHAGTGDARTGVSFGSGRDRPCSKTS